MFCIPQWLCGMYRHSSSSFLLHEGLLTGQKVLHATFRCPQPQQSSRLVLQHLLPFSLCKRLFSDLCFYRHWLHLCRHCIVALLTLALVQLMTESETSYEECQGCGCCVGVGCGTLVSRRECLILHLCFQKRVPHFVFVFPERTIMKYFGTFTIVNREFTASLGVKDSPEYTALATSIMSKVGESLLQPLTTTPYYNLLLQPLQPLTTTPYYNPLLTVVEWTWRYRILPQVLQIVNTTWTKTLLNRITSGSDIFRGTLGHAPFGLIFFYHIFPLHHYMVAWVSRLAPPSPPPRSQIHH